MNSFLPSDIFHIDELWILICKLHFHTIEMSSWKFIIPVVHSALRWEKYLLKTHQIPIKDFGSLPKEHEALGVRNDL
jgi:hypothetical protein